jgi:hypothetical protein
MMDLMLNHDLIEGVSAEKLQQCLADLPAKDGEIVQLGLTPQRYIHTMVMRDGTRGVGFYLEKRGPNADQWNTGEPCDGRPKSKMMRPWWQFWGSDFEAFLFTREEMTAVIMSYFCGEESPKQVRWVPILPSYKD